MFFISFHFPFSISRIPMLIISHYVIKWNWLSLMAMNDISSKIYTGWLRRDNINMQVFRHRFGLYLKLWRGMEMKGKYESETEGERERNSAKKKQRSWHYHNDWYNIKSDVQHTYSHCVVIAWVEGIHARTHTRAQYIDNRCVTFTSSPPHI